jgi:ATP-binding cassette subfamily B protein
MSSAFRRLLPYTLRYRRSLLAGLTCSLAATGMSLASPWLLKYAVDDLGTGDVALGALALYAAGLVGLAVVGGVFRFLMRRLIVGASRQIEYDLRNDFFTSLLRQPPAYYQSRRTGDQMSRATNDLGAVRMMIGPAVMYTVGTAATFIATVALMASIDLRLTLIALAPLPVVSAVVKYFGAAIHRRFEQIQAQLSEISALVQENLAGVRVVRAYRQEASSNAAFRRANLEFMARNRRLIQLQGVFHPLLGLLLGLGAVLQLWIGGRAVVEQRITLGEFVAFNAYLGMLSWPMIAFGWVANMIQRGMASWSRMLEVLDAPPTRVDEGSAPPGFVVKGGVEIRDLSFAYGNSPTLDRVSLSIAPGQTVAIVGATGSGKSTLVNLLPRLHEPPRGAIFIDGVDVRDIPLSILRRAIGMAPQEPFLFADAIAENVAFGVALGRGAPIGSDGPADADWLAPLARTPGGPGLVADAAAVARLDKDAADFPQGYDTIIGERGVMLSGGHKQRAAIARALAGDPRILILDDVFSAVDTGTEEEILTGLRRVMRGRTSLLISHRTSTVRDADQIIVMAGGRIVERGSHDELLELDGAYADLHRKQALEEELAQV